MSTIQCDSCNYLRENATEFVLNGVSANVAASLINNTGVSFSASNCEDLQDVLDCLIGRMTDELEAYDVCDWKDFMKKQNSNLYETLKAMLMDSCGQWDALCMLLDMFIGVSPTPHYMAPTPYFRSHWAAHSGKPGASGDLTEFWFPVIYSELVRGGSCVPPRTMIHFGVGLGFSKTEYPYLPGAEAVLPLEAGQVWGTIQKSQLVPTYMTEGLWVDIMRGGRTYEVATLQIDTRIAARLRGYIVVDGVPFNEDLQATYGPDVMVMECIGFDGDRRTGGILGLKSGIESAWV